MTEISSDQKNHLSTNCVAQTNPRTIKTHFLIFSTQPFWNVGGSKHQLPKKLLPKNKTTYRSHYFTKIDNINSLRTDGDNCHQGHDTEIAPKISKWSQHDHSLESSRGALFDHTISFMIEII
jgi:hypothetical protein